MLVLIWTAICCNAGQLSRKPELYNTPSIGQIFERKCDMLVHLCMTPEVLHAHIPVADIKKKKKIKTLCEFSHIIWHLEGYGEKVVVTGEPKMDVDTWKAIHSWKWDRRGRLISCTENHSQTGGHTHSHTKKNKGRTTARTRESLPHLKTQRVILMWS